MGKDADASMHPLSPELYLECLPDNECISDYNRFKEAGARSWELMAWRVIKSGTLGKNALDIIIWNRNDHCNGYIDLGYFHLAYSPQDENVLNIGLNRAQPHSIDWALAMLYYDRAESNYTYQLTEWRRKVRPAISDARRNECRSRDCLTVVASIANSSPVLARRIGREENWQTEGMIDAYGNSISRGRTTPSLHRQRRAQKLRDIVL